MSLTYSWDLDGLEEEEVSGFAHHGMASHCLGVWEDHSKE